MSCGPLAGLELSCLVFSSSDLCASLSFPSFVILILIVINTFNSHSSLPLSFLLLLPLPLLLPRARRCRCRYRNNLRYPFSFLQLLPPSLYISSSMVHSLLRFAPIHDHLLTRDTLPSSPTSSHRIPHQFQHERYFASSLSLRHPP